MTGTETLPEAERVHALTFGVVTAYSSLGAIIGSSREALNAGKYPAVRPTPCAVRRRLLRPVPVHLTQKSEG